MQTVNWFSGTQQSDNNNISSKYLQQVCKKQTMTSNSYIQSTRCKTQIDYIDINFFNNKFIIALVLNMAVWIIIKPPVTNFNISNVHWKQDALNWPLVQDHCLSAPNQSQCYLNFPATSSCTYWSLAKWLDRVSRHISCILPTAENCTYGT